MKRVAVLLSGSGFLDGAEIRESVLTLLALDEAGASYQLFAPNINQHHVINHLTGEETVESRNVLVEAARIARGEIEDIKNAKAIEFDALLIPGGYGVAKTLTSFAFEGCSAEVEETVKNFIYEYRELNRPIGAICISPALIALTHGDKGIELTIGSDEQTAEQLELIGAKHKECKVQECVVDKKNKIVTTPAYMYEKATISEVFKGIKACVDEVLRLS